MEHKANGGPNWAAERVRAATMRDGVAFPLVFLRGEVQADRSGGLELPRKCCVIAQATGTEVEPDIVQGKGSFIGGCACVLAKVEEEEEGKAGNVGEGAFGG